MGPIQSSVNQMLGTAAIGAGFYAQSPVGKRMAELRQLNLQEQVLNKKREALSKHITDKPSEIIEGDGFKAEAIKVSNEERKQDAALLQEKAEIAKKRFELKPTSENFTAQEQAAEIAERSMQAEKARKQAQEELMNKPRIYDAQGNIINRSK